jgi:hypothetical protein
VVREGEILFVKNPVQRSLEGPKKVGKINENIFPQLKFETSTYRTQIRCNIIEPALSELLLCCEFTVYP